MKRVGEPRQISQNGSSFELQALGGYYPRGYFPGGYFPEGYFPGGYFLVVTVPRVIFQGDIFLVATFPGVIFQGDIFMVSTFPGVIFQGAIFQGLFSRGRQRTAGWNLTWEGKWTALAKITIDLSFQLVENRK